MKRTRRSKRVTRKGGKFIYRGSFGCAFKPAIQCDGTRKNGYISKVMSLANAKDEYKRVEPLKSIDPNFDYFVYPDEICNHPEFTAENKLKNCALNFPNGKVLLFSPDGGYNLSQVTLPGDLDSSFDDLMLNINRLFRGLQLLHQNGYTHNDIKPDNIVVKYSDTDSYSMMRFIDFGLMSKITENTHTISNGTPLYIPLDNYFLNDNPIHLKTLVQNFYTMLVSATSLNIIPPGIVLFWKNCLDTWDNGTGNNLLNTYYTIQKSEEIRIHILKQRDVYALAITIYNLIKQCKEKIVKGKNQIINTKKIADFDNYTKSTIEILTKMMHPDPFWRIGLDDSLKQFGGLWEKF